MSRKTAERRDNITAVAKQVADQLGNTPAVCRNSYLDPRLLEAFEKGEFPRLFNKLRIGKRKWLRRDDQTFRHLLAQT